MEGLEEAGLEVGKPARKSSVQYSPGDKALIGNKKEGRARRENGCDLTLSPFFVSTAPAGDRGLQPSNPSLGPAPASSVSLPNGHLGCISPLS